MDDFYALCKKFNLRATPQRVAIYESLLNDTTHPSAENVHQRVKKIYPNISLDTVNRTLLCFSEIGIIQTIPCSGCGRKYDPNTKAHHHLKCLTCGSIFDFYDARYDRLMMPAKVTKDFTVFTKRVVLSGVCRQCKQKKRRNYSHGRIRTKN
jgi:Fur family transcriptional regulator, peroxide stress response regulator